MRSEHEVVSRIVNALQRGRAIKFCEESPDNELPEIRWQIFGLIDTDEIAVTATCGEFKVGISEQSWLLYPPMADRIFGIDQGDLQLAHKLTHDLWTTYSMQLIEHAAKIRFKKN
jgi:hypothetical protein